MPSIESATSLITAVSIGIIILSILLNNINFDRRDKNTKSNNRLVVIFVIYAMISMFVGLSSSIYYLYLVEFNDPIFKSFSYQDVFVITSVSIILGVYMSVGVILLLYSNISKILLTFD